MNRKKLIPLILLVIFLQVPAADAADTWPGYPRGRGEKGEYQVIPGVMLYCPEATLNLRTDVFPPDLELAKDLKIKSAITKTVYSNNEQAQAVYDVFEHIAEKMGAKTVQNFTWGIRIYSLPDFGFANMRAEKAGMGKINACYFSFSNGYREIWIRTGHPSEWKNVLVHELGHFYDIFQNKVSNRIYAEYLRENAPKAYFGALPWMENPSEWFAEAFAMCYGYPDLDRYPPLNLYETYQPGIKAEIMRGAKCIEKKQGVSNQ